MTGTQEEGKKKKSESARVCGGASCLSPAGGHTAGYSIATRKTIYISY